MNNKIEINDECRKLIVDEFVTNLSWFGLWQKEGKRKWI